MPASRVPALRWRRLPAAVLVTAAAAGFAATAASAAPTPGAPGVGDRLFPELGNGGYDVGHYDLGMRYSTANGPVTVSTTITARAEQDLSRFDLDFAGGRVLRVRVDGRAAAWSRRAEELVITPAAPLADGRRFVVDVETTGSPTNQDPNRDGVIPWFTTPDGSAMAPQPNGAHQIFPCDDHPSDKASYTFRLNVPAGLTAVANGVARWSRTGGGRTVSTFVQREPLASELVQVVVGRFGVVRQGTAAGVRLRDVGPTRLVDDLRPEFATTPDHLQWLEDHLGAFPFPIYGTLAVDTDLGFALETQTIALYPADLFLPPSPAAGYEPVMVHEDAHEWFGDSVSPAMWSDVWLNEGHATWYEWGYGAYRGWTSFTGLVREAYRQSDRMRAQYGPPASPRGARIVWDLFNPDVYAGGALVLYALRQEVGAATFDAIERAYVERFRGGVASTAGFIALASDVAGRDLGGFLTAWAYAGTTPSMPGHPDWHTAPAGAGAARVDAGAAGGVRRW